MPAVVGALASMVALRRASRALAGMATGMLVRKASHVQHVMANTATDRILLPSGLSTIIQPLLYPSLDNLVAFPNRSRQRVSASEQEINTKKKKHTRRDRRRSGGQFSIF